MAMFSKKMKNKEREAVGYGLQLVGAVDKEKILL